MCGARFLVAAFLALWSVALGAQEAEQGAGAPAPEQPTAVFEEAVDVNAVTVHVSVVDRDGQPVRGLGANAFAVFEGNQLLEVVGVDELGGGTGGGQRPAHLVILVDNTSLQKRSRAKVLDGVAELAAQAATAGSRVMVVVLGEQREVLLPLSSDPAAVRLALTSVADAKTYGELSASAKRSLKREISGVDLHRDMAPATTNPFAASAGTQHINVFGQQYLQRINGLRLQELKRARFNLFQVEDLLRGMAGLPGRKDLVWVTEDLEICPLLDVYQVFYGKFDTWAQELGLQHPEQWAQEAELTEPLTQLSFVATASGTALHVLDLTDRDRQAADVSMDVTDKAMFAAGTAAGERSAAGYDLAGTGGMVGGFREAARSTGGSFHSGGSDRASFFKSFGACVTSGYAVTYQRPGAADGQVHPVRVELRGAGELIAPNAVGNRTHLAATIGDTSDSENDYSHDAVGPMLSVAQHGATNGNRVAEKRVGFTYDATDTARSQHGGWVVRSEPHHLLYRRVCAPPVMGTKTTLVTSRSAMLPLGRFSISLNSWLAAPTGSTSRPPGASCYTSAGGPRSGAAAPTIASNGARSGQP